MEYWPESLGAMLEYWFKLDSKIALYFTHRNDPIFRAKQIFLIYSVNLIFWAEHASSLQTGSPYELLRDLPSNS